MIGEIPTEPRARSREQGFLDLEIPDSAFDPLTGDELAVWEGGHTLIAKESVMSPVPGSALSGDRT